MDDHFLMGSIIGITQTIVGHPLDTLKIRSQNNISRHLFKNLYNGVSYPLMVSLYSNSLLFGIFDYSKKQTNNIFLSGVLSGGCMSFVVNPLEVYKIKKQNNINIKIPLYRGLPIMIVRESIASGVYFSTFFYLKERHNSFISGGIAGWGSWLLTYPLDTIKTRIQSNPTIKYIEAYKTRQLWKGFTYCSYRAFLVNGISFYIYDLFTNT